jgi:hypothetical protein
MYLVNNVYIFFYFTFYKMIYTMIVNELLNGELGRINNYYS